MVVWSAVIGQDEAFYLPCVLSLESVEAFLGAGLGWLGYYNYARVHFGYGMAGRTPYGCCVALGFSGSGYVGLMSVVLLDDIVLDWSRQGLPAVNDVLAHYINALLTFPNDFELSRCGEPQRKLNSRANSGEVRHFCRVFRRVWCGVFLAAVLSSKLGGVLGVV
jgi:hypothetical protein